MDRAYVQWNIVNWITVFLMVMIGYLVLTTGIALIAQNSGKLGLSGT